MSTTTATDIINGALRLLQVASPDVVLTASEANDALDALNLMVDSWSNESLMVSHVTKETFAVIPGHNPYTIGAGGDFDTERPIAIEGATFNINNIDYPVQSVAFDDWSSVRLKLLSTIFPDYLYYDATFPMGAVYFHPIPSTTSTITLYNRKPFTQFTGLTDALVFPPGYARLMKYGLAIEIAPEYQTTAGDDVKAMFVAAKAGIKRTNKRPITSSIDPALFPPKSRRFNIFRGN